MTIPVLATKLHIPQPQANLIARPHLVARLDQGLRGKLTLISAPAGFGKTTIVSEWIACHQRQVAWLSLSESDGDLAPFLTYVVAAFQTLWPHVGEGVMGMLQSPQLPPSDMLLTTLLNDLAALPDETVLVLDDYHVLDSPPVDAALTFLIDHLPAHIHVMMTTREDPQLPLARLRARRQLSELRVADLRFSPVEVASFFTDSMGLTLSNEEITTLDARTEGWIAGLQLAALSMQGQPDLDRFIQSFTGTHHFVLDYLIEEVLERQPPQVQTFLLHTSILDRLCGALCDAVLPEDDVSGQAMLDAIHQANLFLIPLDNTRHWYRYHHLFGDFLRQRLHQRLTAAEVEALHSRASQWYEANGYEIEAFHHAAAAHDIERAERLIEGEGVPLYFRGAARPILKWLASLPESTLDAQPSLWVTYASALTITGQQTNRVEAKLQAAEAVFLETESDPRSRNLLGYIATIRGLLAGPQYDIDTMLAQSQTALEYLSEDNLAIRTLAMWSRGLAHQYRGERALARQAYTEVVSISQSTDNVMVTIAALTCLGQMQEAENQLYLAEQSYQQVLELVGDPPWPTTCEAYLGLARLHYQWGDLPQSEALARQGHLLGQQIENVDTPVACGALIARSQAARGDLDGAVATLTETEQFARQHNFLNQMPLVVAENARILLAQGNPAAAGHLTGSEDLPFSQARAFIAQQDYAGALSVLAAARQAAEAKAWLDEQLQVMVLEAVAYDGQGDRDMARARLDEALALAAPGGFVRLFTDEGPPMHRLLSDAAARGIMPDYTRRLLAVFDVPATPGGKVAQPLIEPLSDRELEILHLVADGLSNRDISERLYLALSTVKGHNRHIFDKLGVKRRTEAVARARELGLL